MIDPKQLLEQMLGSSAAGNARNAGREIVDRLDATKGSKAFAGGAMAGGLFTEVTRRSARPTGALASANARSVMSSAPLAV